MSTIETAAEPQPARGKFVLAVGRLAEPRILGPAVGAGLVVIAALVIHAISGQIHLNDIKAALDAVTLPTIAPALALTLLSFMAMGMYDVMAVHRVAPERVPARFAVFAGLVGYGISNAIGFNVIVGGPVRYRIYQAAGLDAADVGRIVGISFLTFTSGIVAVLGAAMMFDRTGLPFLHVLGPGTDRLLGAGILVLLAAAIVWLSRAPRELALFGWRLPLPTAKSALAQIVIGAVDIGAAAGALYVLLPADIAPGYAVFLLLFVAAILAGIVSHAPGGIGVLEATVLLGLGAGTRPDVVAALIIFRLVYYVLPLVLAAGALLVFEIYRARHSVLAASNKTYRVSRRIVPPILAVMVFLGGVVLLLSGNLPAEGDRTGFLSDVLPLPFAEASHLLASLVGLFLIILSRGLYRRIARARSVAIGLLLAGAVFSLLKGLDWEEAIILTAVAALLFAYRSVFYRKGDWRSFRPNVTVLALMAIVLAMLTLIGFLAYRHVDYDSELWWQFAWDGDASRFLRATLALIIVAAAIAIDGVINRPHPPKLAGTPIPPAVWPILQTTPHTQPSIALLGDKSFLVSEDEKAFLMYAVSGRSWITMGDPVGDPASGRRLVWRFAEAADRAGGRAVFYGVTPEWLTTYLDLGLAILKIGEVARVELPNFTLDGQARADFRYGYKRAAREGLEFSIIPKAEMPAHMAELRSVSDAWLSTKVGHEKGFSLGRFEDRYMAEFDCAVIRKDGAIVAFANLWRSGDKTELSVDLMRYRYGVSKILMDALFAHLMLYGKAEGYQWFNLGAAPLAGLADHPLASTWNRLGTFIYRRGDEFYNFEGLRAFKQKFDPVWTPQYLASPNGLRMPQVLYDVTSLISGNPIRILKR
ncbi:bifunctional lysylphosphatidylglycerol flippase/synthetase MprF [Tianweitania sp. BSSL-BM11]|uniref:Phosphatidylglycerol lysyltransferase n=1 Tax=Tianweitania aestuarii TaxID=2814886 RepID=A0ABS5RUD3_9HYPH|nr:bifunctional lysylphosphatidylglycerol flippase/synthetase MprF [Tianweitania aestuarii]MBS9720651.1 bifunctional lysylphosphatidylglycerol flippase/synthetase MprF [Tianweitania aestuarii]